MFDYSYAVAYISAKETSLLTRDALSRITADTDAVKLLSQNGYGGDGKTVPELVDNELSALRSFIAASLPQSLSRLLILPYDAHNLKVLLKCQVSGADPEPYLYDNTVFDTEIMAACCRGGEFSLLSDLLASLLNPAYDDGRLSTPFGISTAVDSAFRTQITTEACTAPQPICEYITAETDGKNLITYFRALRAGLDAEALSSLLLPGGTVPADVFNTAYGSQETDLRAYTFGYDAHDAFITASERVKESLSAASDALDSYAMSKLEPYKYETDSPVPVFLYFKKKTAEARHVREAFTGGAV